MRYRISREWTEIVGANVPWPSTGLARIGRSEACSSLFCFLISRVGFFLSPHGANRRIRPDVPRAAREFGDNAVAMVNVAHQPTGD